MHRLHLTSGLTGGLRLQAPRGPTQTPVVTAWSEKAVRVQLLSGQPMPRAGRPWQSCPGSLPAGQQQTNLTSPTCLTGTQPHGGREADERVCHIGQNSFCLCTMQKLSMCMCVCSGQASDGVTQPLQPCAHPPGTAAFGWPCQGCTVTPECLPAGTPRERSGTPRCHCGHDAVAGCWHPGSVCPVGSTAEA